MSDISGLGLLVFAYFSFWLAKTCLCYARVGTAMGVVVRYNRRNNCLFWLTGLLVGIPLYLFLAWPFILWQEKLSFFVIYSKRRVMQEVSGAL